MSKRLDLIGKQFGKWTVLSREPSGPYGKSRWLCQCACGNLGVIDGTQLNRGKSLSCGCNRHEKKIEDLTGKTFGYLKVLKRVENKGDLAMWECECLACPAHKHTIVAGSRLKRGLVKSCGCMQMKSYGERKIEEILFDNNIPYERQKGFEDCIFPDSHGYAKFDFWINNKYLLEYDGQQHFQTIHSGWDTPEHLLYTQKHDIFKNEWCKEHSIPLIRIPYTAYDTLCLNDLLLETSQYIKNGEE